MPQPINSPQLSHPGHSKAPARLSVPLQRAPLHHQDFFSVLWRWSAVTGVAVLVFSFSTGIHISSLYAVLVFAVLIGLINAFMTYIITMSTFSVTILSVGIGALGVNFFTIEFFSHFPQFALRSLSDALIATILISLATWFVSIGLADSQIHV